MDVRIVELEPIRVASTVAYGKEPETMAWQKLLDWAKPRHLLDKPHRMFGFNNPNPTPGSPNYGYEVWLTVGPDVQSDDTVKVIEFPGGRYAVTRCMGTDHIATTWQAFVKWIETSPHQPAQHQWLEEHLNINLDVPPDEFTLDLYLPIRR